MTAIAYSDKYIYDLPEGHRFPIRKYRMIMERLLSDQLAGPENIYDPGLAGEEILLAHDPSYYSRVLNAELTPTEIRALGIPLHEASLARALNSVAGTIKAAEHAIRDRLGITIGGGYHHAYADHGEGFCIFNDLAITARYLIRQGSLHKVLIIDLDVHQGNGTASILKEDQSIFTFSMHGAKNYPLKKEQSDLDIELPDGAGDRQYLQTLERGVHQVMDKFHPDLILYQAGVDVLETDQLGRLALSLQGCQERDALVSRLADRLNIPLVITLGGGYSRNVYAVVDAHVNTIRTALERLS